MTGIPHRSLVLAALVLLAPCLRAAEGPWASTPLTPPAPPNQNKEFSTSATLGPPATLLTPKPFPNGLPVPTKGGVQPASFDQSADAPPTAVRGQSADDARPIPKKPSIWGEPVTPFPPGTIVSESVPVIGRAAAKTLTEGPPPTPVAAPVDTTTVAPVLSDACWDWRCGFLSRLGAHLFGCCEPGCCPEPENCLYANTEYLLWWIKSTKPPPLITSGGANDQFPGALGQPGTTVLFGGQSLQHDPFSGLRFTLGLWCDECHNFGIEGSFFTLFQQSSRFSATSGGSPVLARPFFNAGTGNEDSELIAFPNLLAGTGAVSLTTRLLGAEANLRTNLCKGCCYRVDLLTGFRFLGLDESLNINESIQTLQIAGGAFRVWDGFSTSNRFYGGQVGLDTEFRRGHWFLDLKGKVALGSNNQVVNIHGNTVTTDPRTGTSSLAGGLLALSSNSGRFTREMFAVAPEGTISVGYQICENVRAYVGYNFLYISDVARPANQIDRAVNTSFLPPATPSFPVRPAFVFKGTDFWAQGVNFGLEFRY
jgi:hypothetical protein